MVMVVGGGGGGGGGTPEFSLPCLVQYVIIKYTLMLPIIYSCYYMIVLAVCTL